MSQDNSTPDAYDATQLPAITPEERREKQELAIKDALVVAMHTFQADITGTPVVLTSIVQNEAVTRYHRDPIFHARVDTVWKNMLHLLHKRTPQERGGLFE